MGDTDMRHGDEDAQVAEWLYLTLAQDEELAAAVGVPLEALPDRVWPDVAPAGTPTPWVVYSFSDGIDYPGLGGGPRIMTTATVNVRAVTEGQDPGAAAAIQRRLYDLLVGNHNVALTGGGMILTGRRAQVLSYPETAAGIEYRHTGGLFTVEVN